MADIESTLITEIAANNVAPSPDGLPPNSSPTIVYTEGREVLAMNKRWWNRVNATVTSGGTANAQTINYGVAPLLYVQGQRYTFIAGLANTGALTLNVNGLGAKNVNVGGGPLAGGELQPGLVVEVVYDNTGAFQILSGAGYLPAAGGTLTGALTIQSNTYPTLALNGLAGSTRQIIAQTSGFTRWQCILANGTAEAGANSGSDLNFSRFSDAGTFIDVPFSITRSTGLVTLAQNLTVNGGGQTIYSAAGATNLVMNKAAGAFGNNIFGQRAAVNRWQLSVANSATETGSGNTGSDIQLVRYTDGGTVIDNPIYVNRSNAVTTFSVAIVNGPSDRTMKENIAPLDGALDKVKALQGVSFNMKATPEKREIGLVAQDVEAVVPEVIQPFQNGIDSPKLALDYPKLTALLIEAVKTLTERIEKLEARLPLAPETA